MPGTDQITETPPPCAPISELPDNKTTMPCSELWPFVYARKMYTESAKSEQFIKIYILQYLFKYLFKKKIHYANIS